MGTEELGWRMQREKAFGRLAVHALVSFQGIGIALQTGRKERPAQGVPPPRQQKGGTHDETVGTRKVALGQAVAYSPVMRRR